jgi:Domain of unknown function (DUF6089)
MIIARHKILFLKKTVVLTLFYGVCSGQSAEISVFGGVSNYLGELTNQYFTPSNAGSVLGLNFKYPLNGHFYLRGSVAQGNLSGYDRDNSPDLRARNLSFQTKLTDGYLAAEYRIWTTEHSAITPYFFSGLGVFHYNPYVIFGDKNEKVYLQPLGTEGQGLPEYPDRKMYKLTQVLIPFGAGLLWTVNDKWLLGIEFRQNFTFTDYLDDVSTRYALSAPLLRDRGPLAVELAWRRDEYDGRPYSNNEGRRGNPDNKDWYYYLGLHAGFRLQGNSGSFSYKKSKNQLGCPKW